MKLKKLIQEELPPAALHATVNSKIQFDENFLQYIMKIENDVKTGYKNGKWMPHVSPEGGFPTIGYGHKIKSKEELSKFKNGASNGEIEKLLIDDLNIALKNVKSYVKNKYKVDLHLDLEQSEILTEFAFNLGSLDKFPKFTDAVLRKNWEVVKKEYKRTYSDSTGNRKELSKRNKEFFDRYLARK